VEQQFAELFAERCATRLAGRYHGQTPGAEQLRDAGDVAAFAGAIDAFKGDELASLQCFPPF
jgi:hypothetical protein